MNAAERGVIGNDVHAFGSITNGDNDFSLNA